MNLFPRTLSLLAVGTLACLALPGAAQTATYTFEAPQFTVNEKTPILNQAPNAGDPTFLASFTGSNDPGDFRVTLGGQNALMVGNDLTGSSNSSALTIAFNTPVSSFSVDYAINAFNGAPASTFEALTAQGTFTSTAANVGGIFQGGTLAFSTAVPISSVTLEAFAATGAEQDIAIDNLQLTTTPEPSALAFLLTGGIGAGLAFRRRNHK